MPSAMSSRSRHSSARARAPQAGTKERKDVEAAEWVEPPLVQTKASYEDHGGAPFGVLEDMLPLGQVPNAKVRSRVRAEPGSKKSALGKSTAGAVSDTQDTPETTPAFDQPASSFDPAALSTQPLIVFDDEKDQDYMPRKTKKSAKGRASRSSLARTAASSPTHTTASAASSTPAAAPPLEDVSTTASSTVAADGTPTVSKAKRTPRNSTPLKVATGTPQIVPSRPNLGEIIDAAVIRSHEVNNPVLGLALCELYKESLADQHLMDLLGIILDQEATPEQAKEFRDHVSRVKKRIRAGADSGHKRRKSSEKWHDTPASESTTSPKSAPAPELVPRQSIEAPAAPPRPKISIRVNPPKKTSITIQRKPKTNGINTSIKRSHSMSSTSSLSSLTSMEEDGMDIDSDDDTAPQRSLQENTASVVNGAVQPNGLSVAHATGMGSIKRSSADAEMEDVEDEIVAKKLKLSEAVIREDKSRPSFERTARIDSSPSIDADSSSIMPPVELRANGHTRQSLTGRRDSPDMGSPLTDISSPPSTRHGTPRTSKSQAKTIKKKAKTKQSPVKKQTANYGGEPNGSGGKESPIGYDDNEESDNNDFCSSCRGSGYLLCCDGCDRSFHFACLDPPLSQDASELEEPWYCFMCVAKRAQPQKHKRGLFSALLSNLDKRNPSIFSLPQDVRDYFEGVATGKDGRFLEAANSKTRSRTGYDELPDHFKMKDAKGQAILCYQCNLSSMGRREIITCDSCNAHWHLDCLDPPLANAPYRDQWGKKIRDWLCPLHVEHELREMDVARLAARQLERERKVYMRKPRNAKVVDTALNRGFINEGVVEVINDESEEESDFYEEEVSGVVYRLPEKGIKLDFIDRVHQVRYALQADADEVVIEHPHIDAPPSQLSQPEFVRRSFLEQQTALSLIQFANQQKGLDLSGDQIETLLGTVIAEAPADVVSQMLEAEKQGQLAAAKEAEQQRKKLELLQVLIGQKIESLKNGT